MFMFLFLFFSMLLPRENELAVTMLIFQINRIISSFFFENGKNLGGSDDGKRRKKKRMAKGKNVLRLYR